MFYVYDNHTGGPPYITQEELDYNDLWCETCGDRDSFLASFETEEEALVFIEKGDI